MSYSYPLYNPEKDAKSWRLLLTPVKVLGPKSVTFRVFCKFHVVKNVKIIAEQYR